MSGTLTAAWPEQARASLAASAIVRGPASNLAIGYEAGKVETIAARQTPPFRWLQVSSQGGKKDSRRRPSSDPRRVALRRTLGGSSGLPHTIRCHYTEGERAVLFVIAGEVKRFSVCDLSIKEIADRAGVRRTTVQNALHWAARLRHVEVERRPQPGRKNLTNVIRIVSSAWRAWLARGTFLARIGFKTVSTSRNVDKEERRPAREGWLGRRSSPLRALAGGVPRRGASHEDRADL
jgi:hypothetical protein